MPRLRRGGSRAVAAVRPVEVERVTAAPRPRPEQRPAQPWSSHYHIVAELSSSPHASQFAYTLSLSCFCGFTERVELAEREVVERANRLRLVGAPLDDAVLRLRYPSLSFAGRKLVLHEGVPVEWASAQDWAQLSSLDEAERRARLWSDEQRNVWPLDDPERQ